MEIEQQQISHASKLISYLEKNRYLEINSIPKNADIFPALKAYIEEDSTRELVNMILDGQAWVGATSNIIAYEPIVGNTGTDTLAEALRELNLPQGNTEKHNLKYYQLFAQIAGIVLPQLLFAQESNSSNLVKQVTTVTDWLNTIKTGVLEKFNDTKSKELLAFINELGSQQDNRSKRKDFKVLDKVLQKWFIDNKYIAYDNRQNIAPTDYFEFELERMLENYDSEYSDVINEMIAELLNTKPNSKEEDKENV